MLDLKFRPITVVSIRVYASCSGPARAQATCARRQFHGVHHAAESDVHQRGFRRRVRPRGRPEALTEGGVAEEGAAPLDAFADARAGAGPQEQIPSMGCSIKWKEAE